MVTTELDLDAITRLARSVDDEEYGRALDELLDSLALATADREVVRDTITALPRLSEVATRAQDRPPTLIRLDIWFW